MPMPSTTMLRILTAPLLALLATIFLAMPVSAAKSDEAPASSSTGKRIALVIGNGAYQSKDLPKLGNPANDAEDIAAALRGFGFEVMSHRNLGRRAMKDAIADFGRRAGNAEAALFYYAGHGVQIKNQNYLIPIDLALRSEADVMDEAINVNLPLEEMDIAKSRINIVILDACRDNPISGKFRSAGGRGLAAPHGNFPKGTVIVYATDPGNTALDGVGRNGTFTAGLLNAFKGKDLSLDGVLTTTSEYVDKASKGTQTPYVNGPQLVKKNFQFAVTVNPGNQEIEKLFWESIKDSQSTADFEAYLKKYPKGDFKTLAENRLRALQRKAAATPMVVTPSATPPMRPTSDHETERVFWESVKNSQNTADFEAYLKKYPKGDFRALAENRLRVLQRSSATAQGGSTAVLPPLSPQSQVSKATPPVATAAEQASTVPVTTISPQHSSAQPKRVTASGQSNDVLYKWVSDNPRDLRVE